MKNFNIEVEVSVINREKLYGLSPEIRTELHDLIGSMVIDEPYMDKECNGRAR